MLRPSYTSLEKHSNLRWEEKTTLASVGHVVSRSGSGEEKLGEKKIKR
jgi:hypothetical protein